MGVEVRTTRPRRTILSCWEIDGSVLRYLRADLNETGLPTHSTHGSFESPVDLDALLSDASSGSGLPNIALPALYDDIVLLVHPWLAPTFTTLVDPDWNAARVSEHVETEALTVLGDPEGGRLRYEYVGNDLVGNRRLDRILVTSVPDRTFEIARLLARSGLEVRSTLAVVAGLIAPDQKFGREPESTEMYLGWYSQKAELTVVQDGSLQLVGFVTFEDARAGLLRIDTLLTTVGLADRPLKRIHLYGHEIDQLPFRDSLLFSQARAEWLQPDDLFEGDDRPVTSDSRFALVAAGALAHLIPHV